MYVLALVSFATNAALWLHRKELSLSILNDSTEDAMRKRWADGRRWNLRPCYL